MERSVQYVRGNFWPGLRFSSLDDLNTQARTWLDTVANVRVHATTGVSPISRLAAEGLATLGDRPTYDITPILLRQASRDGWVRYASNAYAIPLAYASQPLLVKLTERDEVLITTPHGTPVACHPRAMAHGVQVGSPTSLPDRSIRAGDGGAMSSGAIAPQVDVRSLAEYDVLLEDV